MILGPRGLSMTWCSSVVKRHGLNQNQRRFIVQASKQTDVFDKKLRVKHLDISSINKDAHVYDYLRDHVAKDLCDRVSDLKLDSKKLILNLGSCSSLVTKNLDAGRVESLLQCDISEQGLRRSRRLNSALKSKYPIEYILCDEEYIPVKSDSIDLVMSCMNLHWVNDLLGCFRQVRNILKDDRPFIGSLLGGDTLYEFRSSVQLAELERLSGFSSHVAPKTTGQDVARLLQASGFQLITVDISELRINYPSIFELMFDLQGMGENNASLLASNHMHRDVMKASAAIYQSLYGKNSEDSRGVPATFQVIHFIGWKSPTKATPLRSEQ